MPLGRWRTMLAETEEFLANEDTEVMKLIEASESKGWFTGTTRALSMGKWWHFVTNIHQLSIISCLGLP